MHVDTRVSIPSCLTGMRFSTFKQLTQEQVVDIASRLFVALGADPQHRGKKTGEWRDDSLKGSSAVYEVSHGYRLGEPGDDMAITVTEKWSDHENNDAPIAHAIDIHTSGQIDLSIRYRHGQLRCTFNAADEPEKKCLDILDQL